MNHTSIEWTHRPETGGAAGGFTWNPIRARLKASLDDVRTVGKSGTFCTRISPGCTNCYASVINKRFGNGLEYTVPNLEKVEFYLDEKILAEPLKRKRPATIFVGDMFDLFHEAIPDAEISYVFATMHDAKQHTFQLLTKRAERMMRFVHRWGVAEENIWLGVSVESQKYADERIPLLLQTTAAVRFLSVEPMLEAVDLTLESPDGMPSLNVLNGADWCDPQIPRIDWVICGGESGPGARPFNLAWAESLLDQCRAAGVPFFMKQIGSHPIMTHDPHFKQLSSKGGEMWEWPASLRVREFPSQKVESVSA